VRKRRWLEARERESKSMSEWATLRILSTGPEGFELRDLPTNLPSHGYTFPNLQEHPAGSFSNTHTHTRLTLPCLSCVAFLPSLPFA
jgi:hypothetical protein